MRRQGLVSKERYLRRDTAHTMRPANRFRTIPATCVSVLTCSGMFWYDLACSGMFWHVLVCSGMFWYVLVCSGMFWYVLVCFGHGWALKVQSLKDQSLTH